MLTASVPGFASRVPAGTGGIPRLPPSHHPAEAAGRHGRTGVGKESDAMSVIRGLGPASPTGRTSTRSEQPASGFAISVPPRPRPADAPAEAPAVMLAGLLALQAEDCDESL